MTVTLTSPVLGKDVGDTYTGDLEAWLLAQGYAKQADYEGPGVSNTGATDVVPAKDPTLASNRDEEPYWPASADRNVTIANDADNLTKTKFPAPGFDFDEGGVDGGDEGDAPSNVTLDVTEGPEEGGTVVTLTGTNLGGATAVNFGATPGTDFDETDGVVTVTTPAGTAGPVDVTVVDPDGNLVLEDAFTYVAAE